MLDSEFHARGFRIPGTSFQSLSVALRLWIPIVSRTSDSLSCIPNSKLQDSGCHKQTFPGFRIPDSTNKLFPDSGFHKQTFPGFQIPHFKSKIFPYYGFHKQNFPRLRISQAKFSRIPVSTGKIFPHSGLHKQKFHGFPIP